MVSLSVGFLKAGNPSPPFFQYGFNSLTFSRGLYVLLSFSIRLISSRSLLRSVFVLDVKFVGNDNHSSLLTVSSADLVDITSLSTHSFSVSDEDVLERLFRSRFFSFLLLWDLCFLFLPYKLKILYF